MNPAYTILLLISIQTQPYVVLEEDLYLCSVHQEDKLERYITFKIEADRYRDFDYYLWIPKDWYVDGAVLEAHQELMYSTSYTYKDTTHLVCSRRTENIWVIYVTEDIENNIYVSTPNYYKLKIGCSNNQTFNYNDYPGK